MTVVHVDIPLSELENMIHELTVIRGHVADLNASCRTCRAVARMKIAVEAASA